MIKISALISIFYSIYALATPKDVEVWFLTIEPDSKNSVLLKMIDPDIKKSKK